jgi:hypothetical protein
MTVFRMVAKMTTREDLTRQQKCLRMSFNGFEMRGLMMLKGIS